MRLWIRRGSTLAFFLQCSHEAGGSGVVDDGVSLAYCGPPDCGLSSDAKCNTPRRFDIGKVVQDLKECCHAILCASVGGRKRPDRRFAGRGAIDGGHCPGARSGESYHLPGAAAERSPLGRVLAAAPPGPVLRGRRETSSNERPLYVCSWGTEGWTPEQISGWLKSGNEPRLRAIGCETIYAFIYRAAQKAEILWRYLTRRHKRRRKASRQGLARRHQGSSVDP